MADILHRVFIKKSPEKVYNAITQQSGLENWWTTMVEAKPETGAVATFRFGDGSSGFDMEIMELSSEKRIAWKCVGGPPEWIDTDLIFDIIPHEKGSVLFFAQRGWEEPSEFYMHCNCKWGFFLGVSLKDYLETGKGRPHPDDTDL